MFLFWRQEQESNLLTSGCNRVREPFRHPTKKSGNMFPQKPIFDISKILFLFFSRAYKNTDWYSIGFEKIHKLILPKSFIVVTHITSVLWVSSTFYQPPIINPKVRFYIKFLWKNHKYCTFNPTFWVLKAEERNCTPALLLTKQAFFYWTTSAYW